MTRRFLAAGLLAGLLLTAACGDDDDEAGGTAGPTETATGTVTETETETETESDPAAAVPTAIASLSATATETLYAIGAADQVLAVDDFSNFPPETADKMQGINAFEPNAEAIIGLDPDLVITDGTNPDFLAQLDRAGVDHWEGPAANTFDDVYAQIEQLGAVTGHVGEAAELVGQMQADIAEVIDGLPELSEPLTYYHELDDTYFSVSSSSFIGAIYSEIGLVNITEQSDEDLGDYPQLSAEFIVDADPDLIFLACTKYCSTTAESVAARPGWDAIAAVQNGGVIELDDDIVSRWGPRVVDFLELAGEAVATVAAAEAVPAG